VNIEVPHGFNSVIVVGQVDQETLEYFRRREAAERDAAKHASSEEARRVHKELAQEYAQLLRSS
jgi:hypothetical protein